MSVEIILTYRPDMDTKFFDLHLKENYEHYDGYTIEEGSDRIYLYFDQNPTSQERIDIEAFYTAMTTADLISTKELKIFRYIAKNGFNHLVPPKGLNYKTGLITRLHPKMTFVKGELDHVDYFADVEMTDMVLCVDIVYERDTLGFATTRTTTRNWVREDGTLHPDAKITFKDYRLNPTDQSRESKRRRSNNMENIIITTLHFMVATITAADHTRTQESILQDGRDFLAVMDPFITRYLEAYDKTIVDEVGAATDYWLDNNITALTGVPGLTIRMWMQAELVI